MSIGENSILEPGKLWWNWFGEQNFVPRHLAQPRTEEEVRQAVLKARALNLPVEPPAGAIQSADRRDARGSDRSQPVCRCDCGRPRKIPGHGGAGHYRRGSQPVSAHQGNVAEQSGRYRYAVDLRRPCYRHPRGRHHPALPFSPNGGCPHSYGRWQFSRYDSGKGRRSVSRFSDLARYVRHRRVDYAAGRAILQYPQAILEY